MSLSKFGNCFSSKLKNSISKHQEEFEAEFGMPIDPDNPVKDNQTGTVGQSIIGSVFQFIGTLLSTFSR